MTTDHSEPSTQNTLKNPITLESQEKKQMQEMTQVFWREKMIEQGKDNSSKLTSDDRSVGQAYYRLAKIYFDKADFRKAEQHFLKALDLCNLSLDYFVILKIAGFLVRIYSETLKKEDAASFIDLSKMVLNLVTYQQAQNSLRAELIFFHGVVDTYYGDYEGSKKNFSAAYKKAQEENEPDVVAKSLLSLAQTFYHEKDYKQAIKTLAQLEQLLSILNKGYLKGSMYLLYGNILNQTGEFKKALDYFDQSIKELSAKACWNLLGYSFLGRGISYKKMNDLKTALTYFQMAQNLVNPLASKKLIEKVTKEIGEVHDSNIDFFIDRHNRQIHEKELGTIDFKHRFVLLEILFLLAQNPGKFYDKDELSKEIWKDEYNPLIHDKLIYTSISRLRKLVEPNPEKAKYIMRGKDGYTFNPLVNVSFYQGADVNVDSIANVEIGSPL